MELRPGYKLTEVGVVPEDWEVKPLGELASVTAGGTPSRANPKYWNGDIPWITTSEVDFHTIYHAEQLITKEGLNNSAARLLRSGTLLMALYGQGKTRGKVGILGIEAATNQACAAISLKQGVSQKFIFHFLASRYEAIRNLSNTGNQENLNSSLVRSISVSLPPESEQRAIAAALSDVDALLEGLTRLIAKKRDLKQAAMQQLLTGRTRLPGFHAEWEVKRLGDVGSFLKGSGVKKDQARSGDLPCIRYGEIYTHHNNYIRSFNSWISPSVAATATPLKQGDLLFAGSGETKEEIGKCVAFVNDCEAFAGGDIIILRLEEAHPTFMGYYCDTAPINAQKAAKGQGDAVVHISAAALSSITVQLPSLSEQAAIAMVLSDLDAELLSLEVRREKTRALKQAVTQELLTGRKRLVVPTVTESATDSARTDGRRANIHFMRSVLAAEIIDRLHDEPTFGHVKFEKLIFLVEHLCDVDTGSTYHRDAAGPYDNRTIRSIDSQLRKQKWFDAQKIEGRYRYQPMANRGRHKEYFARYFGGIGAAFDTVINTFRDFKTDRCEIVATLFAAWSDLLQQKAPISDDAIVNEVLNNWHESKKRIPENRWRKELSWMRDHGFVPRKATGAV